MVALIASDEEYAVAGIEYFIVNLPNAFEGGVISRFAEEVFPRVGVQTRV